MAILTVCHAESVGSFACAQAGCPDCLETLLRENDGLIHTIIRRQGIAGIEYEDLIQEGRIALWQSILHFDPGRGYAFSSYAWAAIRHQVWHCLAYANQSGGYREAEAWLASADKIEEDWWRGQVRLALVEVIKKLPRRLRQLIRLAYGMDGPRPYSLAAIGRGWVISRERVRQLHNNALLLLRLPALSMRLRNLCEQDSRPAYLLARSLNRTWQHSQRRRP
ncbi:MAG: sigma-70 family RNA polymerase sigma factor [Anaerolineales bacterium]